MEFDIFEENIERLRGKMKKLEKKCVKYGNPFHYEERGEKFKTVEVTGADDQKGKQVRRYIVVEVSGSPIINNWKFIASCAHTKDGNIFKKACWDVEIPKRYYNSDCICEHCNSKRSRKETYIIQNEKTGEFKQVGKSCLKDYTNGMTAEMAAFYISLYDEVISYEAPLPGCGHTKHYANVEEALLYIAETIRHYGYVPASEEEDSTKRISYGFYAADYGWIGDKACREIQKTMERINFTFDLPENKSLVEKALAWIRIQNGDNDYMHNLKTVCQQEYISYQYWGILCSLFPSYHKSQKREAEKAERTNRSQYVGQIGERIKIEVETASVVASWDTLYGEMQLYQIIGKDGNVFVWKTGTNGRIQSHALILGTVKDHKTYHGIRQTELTRCRTIRSLEPAEDIPAAPAAPVEEEFAETAVFQV